MWIKEKLVVYSGFKNMTYLNEFNPQIILIFSISNVLKFVNVVWNNFGNILLLNVMHWSVFVAAFSYSWWTIVTASINIVYRPGLGLVLWSAVANCGSSNLWGMGWGRVGKGWSDWWQILDQCKVCVSVYK